MFNNEYQELVEDLNYFQGLLEAAYASGNPTEINRQRQNVAYLQKQINEHSTK